MIEPIKLLGATWIWVIGCILLAGILGAVYGEDGTHAAFGLCFLGLLAIGLALGWALLTDPFDEKGRKK